MEEQKSLEEIEIQEGINPIVEENATKDIEKAISNSQNAIPYNPMSKLPSMGTVIPLNLAGETLQAQFKFTEDIPDVDAYLVEKLGYSSKYSLAFDSDGKPRLGAEQADAVALAIRQMEKDKGFILADMAGIGKGRVGASILRYSFVNGYLPIFITEKPNLFTAMYRDILDIGGLKTEGAGKMYLGSPLILNGYKSGGREKKISDDGKIYYEKKNSETGILNPAGQEVITAPDQKEIQRIIKKDSLPSGYDYIMLTYSQLAGNAGKLKVQYLLRLIESLGGKAILVLDECHNASGMKSDVGRSITEIISFCKGVTFISATFSKRPDNMFVYSLKTDVSDSPLGTKKLIEVIKSGGERLTENLASNLVSSQQMIRRERTFENCDVDFQYMQDSEKQALFIKYDDTIKLYREIVKFFTENKLFLQARKSAIDRFVKDKKIEIVTEDMPKGSKEIKEWRRRNEGKYRPTSFTAGEIKRSQFNFIEALLFALKADFVANQALAQLLNDKLENVRVKDKTVFTSNRKPVIAVRNTNEGVFANLGMKVGDSIEKADFNMYVYSLAKSSLSGSITFKEIISESEKGKEKIAKEIKDEITIDESDFSDNGEAYTKLLSDIENIKLNIPLSPIDYIINKIQSTKRATWDNYGDGNPYFNVGEVTGRKYTLVEQPDNTFKLEKNPKPANKSTTFKDFNNGKYDVLLINESGSTGEDAHSSSKFKDQRPRVMIIHQVELDVNTEVQKRGRINRTGMVNYPNYIYAVSRIPSEIRRLLMLVRKLRSLDANTTANQKQSAKLSQIRDSFGNEIEDVINKYGDECLTEFLSVESNSEIYSKYMPTDEQGDLAELSGSYVIETFVRNLELSLSGEQEYFYDTINALYYNLKERLGTNFDLETNIVDLKASIKTRVMVSKGLNTNAFNTSVYEEDDYVLAEDKPYEKDKVEDLMKELANGQDPEEYYRDFVADYKKHFKEVTIKEVAESIKVPDYDLAKDDTEKEEMEAEYNLKKKAAIIRAEDEYDAVLSIIDEKDQSGNFILKPNRSVLIPAVMEECYMTDENGIPIVPSIYNNAKFVGVKIQKIAKEKYSPMNIELIFCQLSGRPKIILKPTAKGRGVLEWVLSSTLNMPRTRLIQIEAWAVDPFKRDIVRMFTGNILGAYGVAEDRVARNPLMYSQVVNFLKFTTSDGTSLRLGIKLNPKRFVALTPSDVPVEYTLNSKELLSDLLKSKKFIKSINSSENFLFFYSPTGNSGQVQIFILGGTKREAKVKKYFSKLYNDGKIREILTDAGIGIKTGLTYYTPIGASRSQTMRYIGFSADLNQNKVGITKLFEYIYSADPFNISLTGVENEDTIFNKMDLFKSDFVPEESEREGRFGYETLNPYENVKDSINSLNKFFEYKRTGAFGTVYLKQRANIKETISYGLVPLDNTIVDMVSDTFQALTSDSDRIKLNEDITKAIKEDKNDFQIGYIVQKALANKVLTLKNIFGYEADDLTYIGKVFRSYSKGEVELPEKKKKLEEDEDEGYKLPKRSLTLENAEEFMILFTYKINN